MLLLVGTGVSYNDISMAAVEACRGCELYVERYTSFVGSQKVEYLEKILGKRITALSREDLEEKAKETVAMADAKDIAILVGGDPLTATTHKILMIEARKQGIKTRILHSSSVIPTVIGESGLDFYRFGQVCTIPRWTERYKPVSFYDTIERNLSRNLHSLVLLDYDGQNERTLPVKDAVAALAAAENEYGKGIIGKSTVMMLVQDVGTGEQRVALTSMGEAPTQDKGRMTTLIIPAKLSEIEEEAMRSMAVT